MTDSRTLRSKKLRLMLWQSADGRCQSCGVVLSSRFDADHTLAWADVHQTNVHEMAALCPRCNRQKGRSSVRAFQSQFQRTLRDIKAGTASVKTILVEVWPGGGKSVLPIILVKEMLGSVIDGVVWVVPRRTLQRQAEEQFGDQKFRRLFNHWFEIRQSTNDIDPFRGKAGIVTTYQAIADNPEALAYEFKRGRRYALVLDEFHHLDRDGTWQRALQPLVDRARLLVPMTGTLQRADPTSAIAFLPYEKVLGGERFDPDRPPSDWRVIRYGLTDALREKAVIPLIFHLPDARVSWKATDGKQRDIGSLEDALRAERGAALVSALDGRYAAELLADGATDWLRVRAATNPRAKLLVISRRISDAKDHLKELQRMGITRAAIATTDDSAGALEAISRFKLSHEKPSAYDALVTVGMAYEGLDAPSVTHVICLTHIRSRPWLIQALNRANRADQDAGPWEQQWGVIFGPKDADLLALAKKYDDWQAPFVRDRQAGTPGTSEGDPSQVVPLLGEQNGEVWAADPVAGTVLETAQITRIAAAANAVGIAAHPVRLHQFLTKYEAASAPESPSQVETESFIAASVREGRMRKQIQKECNKLDRDRGVTPGTHNQRMFSKFGKSRENMTEAELEKAWLWIVAQRRGENE